MRAVGLNRAELAALSAEVLGRGGSFRFRARGSSMAPALRDGDLLTVEPTEAAALRMGDVILYRAEGGRLAAHRVVARQADQGRLTLTARGDAAAGPGEAVRAELVLGRVVGVQRRGRTLDLDGGTRRAAARLWVATAPLGPWLVGGAGRIKPLAAWLLGRLQGWRPYRRLARWLIGRRVRTRAATVEDAPALSALYGYGRMPELADPVGTWAGHLEDLTGAGHVFLASLGGKMVGATVVRRSAEKRGSAPDWWMWGMRVDLRTRGAGIGQGLVRQALESAREEGAGAVYLRVAGDNRAATGLYRKMGFRPAPAAEDGPDRHAEAGGILWVYHF
jgi:ribosomal protein S18 acetylase RimI-like enzyme